MSQKQSNTYCRHNPRLDRFRSHLQKLPLVSSRTKRLENKLEMMRLRTKSGSSFHSTLTEQSENDPPQLISSISQEEEASDMFSDTFELLEKIGEGCNACVYRCIHKPTKRLYAVKKVKLEEEHVLRFRKDFITLKELDHPSICRYKGLYFDGDERLGYLVMEYMPFPSLADYQIQLEQQLKDIVDQIIYAIQYLHTRNICHRDIKPDNILYDPQEKKIKIIDFGVSKKTFNRGARRDMLTIIGTPYYLAPEVYLGGGYDERVDLWALGVTIYRLVTGVTPFQSEYHSSTVANIIKGDVRYHYSKWSLFSPYLKSFVGELLKKVDQRMTLNECKSHLWLQESDSPRRVKFRRNSSHLILVNQQFHQQFKNRFSNAQPKEEGEIIGEKRVFKKLNTLNTKHFDLDDSDSDGSKQQ